jgi:TldD protein
VEVLPETIAKADKVGLLRRADETARATGRSIRQVSAVYGDSRRRILVANSDGVLATDDQVKTRFAVTCVANGDTGMQTGRESIGATVGFELMRDVSVEELARMAAERAITKLSARPAPSGTLPVVIKQGSGGVLFHEACGHGLEADHIAKEVSVFTGRVGQLVASPLVTLVDDGTMASEWGALAIDDEGHRSGRNVLIENGVLTDYMWDWLRARKDGRESSGNGRRENYQCLPMVRMTNTFVLAGDEDPDEIVRQTPHGVYVAQLGGGQVNTATGDFVFGMTEAYLIEDGQLTEPLRDANLIGNGPEVLRNIDVVGNDFAMGSPGTCGKQGQGVPVGTGQPTLRVSALTVGGTAR